MLHSIIILLLLNFFNNSNGTMESLYLSCRTNDDKFKFGMDEVLSGGKWYSILFLDWGTFMN